MSHTPDKELDEILFSMRKKLLEAVLIASMGLFSKPEQEIRGKEIQAEAKAAIQKHYISRAEVLEMIGENEIDHKKSKRLHFKNYYTIHEIEANNYMPQAFARNQLRAELRQKLGADHE